MISTALSVKILLMKAKFWVIFLCLGLALFAGVRFYFSLTDDVRLANMRHSMPYNQAWETMEPSLEELQLLKKILSQEYSYLGKGSQSYAFASHDRKYVIKFFKFKHLRPAWWHLVFAPIPSLREWRERQEMRKRRKLYGVFDGYKVAYDLHRKEAGLLFIHLQPSNFLRHLLVVRDKLGFRHSIDLDQYVFVLQHRAKTTAEVLGEALGRGDLALAEKRLDQLFELYYSEYQKGIYDHDHGIIHNTGFVDEDPIHLDMGKLCINQSMRQPAIALNDMALVLERLNPWIEKHYPEAYPILAGHMQEKLHALYLE